MCDAEGVRVCDGEGVAVCDEEGVRVCDEEGVRVFADGGACVDADMAPMLSSAGSAASGAVLGKMPRWQLTSLPRRPRQGEMLRPECSWTECALWSSRTQAPAVVCCQSLILVALEEPKVAWEVYLAGGGPRKAYAPGLEPDLRRKPVATGLRAS